MTQEMTAACLFQRVPMVLMDLKKVHNHKILKEVVEVSCLQELGLVFVQNNLVMLVKEFLILDQSLGHQEFE